MCYNEIGNDYAIWSISRHGGPTSAPDLLGRREDIPRTMIQDNKERWWHYPCFSASFLSFVNRPVALADSYHYSPKAYSIGADRRVYSGGSLSE